MPERHSPHTSAQACAQPSVSNSGSELSTLGSVQVPEGSKAAASLPAPAQGNLRCKSPVRWPLDRPESVKGWRVSESGCGRLTCGQQRLEVGCGANCHSAPALGPLTLLTSGSAGKTEIHGKGRTLGADFRNTNLLLTFAR
uniref:Uncharacterized protein n=1 Tax=Eutreptiella gymnastica TaxID=73025 RepID=A0A6T2J8Y5_9EUGL